jgi:hypothetical protein
MSSEEKKSADDDERRLTKNMSVMANTAKMGICLTGKIIFATGRRLDELESGADSMNRDE